MTFNGYDYSFDHFVHPQVGPFGANTIYNHTNPIYSQPWSSGGMDGSLLFQKIGGACTKLITNRNGGGQPPLYYDCTLVRQDGKGAYSNNTMCHTVPLSPNSNDGVQPKNSVINEAWSGLAQLEQRHRYDSQHGCLPRRCS